MKCDRKSGPTSSTQSHLTMAFKMEIALLKQSRNENSKRLSLLRKSVLLKTIVTDAPSEGATHFRKGSNRYESLPVWLTGTIETIEEGKTISYNNESLVQQIQSKASFLPS